MLLALSCTSKPANSTGLAFRALISGVVERLELARYTARDLSALAGELAALVEDNPGRRPLVSGKRIDDLAELTV
jgi:hypothetical protein